MAGAMYAKVGGAWSQVFPPLPAYNDATGGEVTEFDEVILRTKVDGQQFTADVGGFALPNGNATVTAEGGLLVVTKVAAADAGAGAASKLVPAAPGDVFTLSFDVVDFPAAAVGNVGLLSVDSADANISGGGSQVSLTGSSGTRLSLTHTMAAGTTKVRIRATINGAEAAGTALKIDNLLLERGAVADPVWFDGDTTLSPTGRRMRAHTFTANDDFVVTQNPNPFRVLVVGAGQDGTTTGYYSRTGYGGSGGKILSDDAATLAAQVHAVTIGSSSGAASTLGALTSESGSIVGGGGSSIACCNTNGGDGGAGHQTDIRGTSEHFGGGGGGGGSAADNPRRPGGSGGAGGGGNGGTGATFGGVDGGHGGHGAANTGGGGGGAGSTGDRSNPDYNWNLPNYPGGNGGSGIVVVAYRIG